MTPHNLDSIHMTMDWFKTAVPEPSSKNAHTQMGVHFEEVSEMLDEMSSNDQLTQRMIVSLRQSLHLFAEHLKKNDHVISINDPVKFLDSLCDQVVTATGVAYFQDYNMTAAMHEVVASNYSKFVDGEATFDENRKILKGPDYFKADLSKFVSA